MAKIHFGQRFIRKLALATILAFVTGLSAEAFAQSTPLSARPANIRSSDALVYHGKLVKPDGRPVTGSLAVQIEIYSPEPSVCLLWSETQNLKPRKIFSSATRSITI